jgi:redox-sensitive bicupin YhaK (pirin superfamily)
MLKIRKEAERGKADHGWLKTSHSFSFADYYDPEHMQFRSLRVINEDYIESKSGFPKHPHNDMEIITYVMEGELQHEDSIGNRAVIKSGEIQVMHAGTGIFHSEKNPAADTTHLLQIWIMPDKRGYEPGYEQGIMLNDTHHNRLTLIVSSDGRDGSSTIHQDADLYVGRFDAGKSVDFPLGKERFAWIQMTRGAISLSGHNLEAGDGAAISEEAVLQITSIRDSEFLLFDLV